MVGSGAMFSDQYIDKEDNHKIKDVIFEFLTEGKVYKYILFSKQFIFIVIVFRIVMGIVCVFHL